MYLPDQFWRGYGLGCTPLPGTDTCFEATGTAAGDPNQTVLLDPFHIYQQDNGAPTGVVLAGGGAGAAAPSSFGRWLQSNALVVGISLVAAAMVIGAAKR